MPCSYPLPRSLVLLTGMAVLLCSSALPSIGQASGGGTEHKDSTIDLYAGYGYFHPVNSGVDGFQYQDVYNPNATVSLSEFFNHFIGLQLEGGYFSGSNQHKPYFPTCTGSECDQLDYTVQAGPVIRLPLGSWVPFVHLLGGGARYNGPVTQPLKWGWGVTGGIGIDYVLPFASGHLAIRPIQADFQYSQVVYGPLVLPSGTQGGFGEIDNLKLSGGVVARLGEQEQTSSVQLGCAATPVRVFAGDPVTITGSTLGLKANHKPLWAWQSTGGKITFTDSTATVDTTGLAPGEYVVSGHVSDGRHAQDQASCEAPFTVRAFEPPTLTCTAVPSTVVSGTDVEISATGTSPQNRSLTYSYTSNAGVLTSTGPTARLSTAGLGQTTITVDCNVVDDLGKSAHTTTQVTVTPPTQPVIPEVQQLCTLSFARDKRRPVRVDNEAKGCLDDIALTLNGQTDARLVMIGNVSADEPKEAAEERVLNAREYLTREKGIDPSRIDVRVGATPGRTVQDVLVPSGASFSEANSQSFNERSVIRHGEAYGTPGRRVRRPGATLPQAGQPAAPAPPSGQVPQSSIQH